MLFLQLVVKSLRLSLELVSVFINCRGNAVTRDHGTFTWRVCLRFHFLAGIVLPVSAIDGVYQLSCDTAVFRANIATQVIRLAILTLLLNECINYVAILMLRLTAYVNCVALLTYFWPCLSTMWIIIKKCPILMLQLTTFIIAVWILTTDHVYQQQLSIVTELVTLVIYYWLK